MPTEQPAAPGGVSRPSEEERLLRCRLADVIDRRRNDIVERWVTAVRHEVFRKDVDITQLRNSIDDYLARIADSLREEAVIEVGATTAWIDVAREHAMNRMQLGFNIEQLVHEFVLLRRVLTDVVQTEKIPGNSHYVALVADFIEAAIATSVGRYVETRDQIVRGIEAEHVGFLTHELRNPLSAAMLAATQLKRTAAGSAEGVRVFELLESSHRRLRRLIDEVLLAERFESGHVEVRPADVNLGEFLADALVAARAAAHAKGLQFNVKSDPGVLLHVDPNLSGSTVQNLADNAVKFTDAGQVAIDVEDGARAVTVHVRDTCPGISAEELTKIFEPFQRGHSGKAGTGLGLAIARRAVEAQGGEIHAESVRGRGSHFWFTLPKFVEPKAGSKAPGTHPHR